ncbi:MAG: hypothetical protein LBI85_03345 [Spirochaetaceae bacterium]|jgi:hypothetical protein|nr:hypothetical protein [Spirochaetaceae bacterium]
MKQGTDGLVSFTTASREKYKGKTLDADMENENMDEDPVYYTTAYEIQIVKTLCVFIAANVIILLSFTLNRLQAAGLGLVHGYIMGMIMSYLVFGITCKKGDRRIVLVLGCGMLGFLAALDWRFETTLVLLCAVAITAVSLWCLRRDRGKADGDYAAFLEDDFDSAWFDAVVEDIGEYPVLFPLDIGNRKRDRLLGRIVEVGMGLHHKYRGIAVAKIKAPSGFYLCPLSSLVPRPSMKCRGSLEIASRTGELSCTVTLYWHEYGSYTVVSENE